MGQKRLPKTTRKQYVELLNFVENNRILLKSKYGPREIYNVDVLWKQFETHINQLGLGPTKTARQWRKIWCEWKANTRRRSRLLHKPEEGKTDVRELAHVEDRLLELLGDARNKNENEHSSNSIQPSDEMEIKSENLSTSFLDNMVEYSKDDETPDPNFAPSEESLDSPENDSTPDLSIAKLDQQFLIGQKQSNLRLNFMAAQNFKTIPDEITKIHNLSKNSQENHSHTSFPTIVPFSEFCVVPENLNTNKKSKEQNTLNYRNMKRLKTIERAKKYKKLQIRQYKATLEIAKSLKVLNESLKQLAEASMVRAKAEMLKIEAMNLKAQVNILKYTNKFD
ncbi:uncharacterized protein LOC123297994 [Chrysoperla carnea]|uniref:uncharacterized protein LOC123297994 n=1 Tax=Chrysoperla carnea TaxID=189513 RepID=UPI001D08BB3E|nr:uncharacterized protein LOC123297994 [Chrysoperla carnea]